jgi:hypothetical protein
MHPHPHFSATKAPQKRHTTRLKKSCCAYFSLIGVSAPLKETNFYKDWQKSSFNRNDIIKILQSIYPLLINSCESLPSEQFKAPLADVFEMGLDVAGSLWEFERFYSSSGIITR